MGNKAMMAATMGRSPYAFQCFFVTRVHSSREHSGQGRMRTDLEFEFFAHPGHAGDLLRHVQRAVGLPGMEYGAHTA